MGMEQQEQWQAREIRTARAMIGIFCRRVHKEKCCPDCDALLAYVEQRIGKCPYGTAKPACAECRTHCYREEMRRRIREVMRFAGPRMIYRHPLMALRHLLGRRGPRRKLPSCFPENP